MIILDIMLKQIKQIEKTLKINDKFKITFYPQNINDDIEESEMQPTTRVAIWNSDCDFVLKPKTKKVSPFIKYFDVEKNGIRTATTMYRAVSIFFNQQIYTWTGK
jgi:hypothetical protein